MPLPLSWLSLHKYPQGENGDLYCVPLLLSYCGGCRPFSALTLKCGIGKMLPPFPSL